MDVIIDGYNLIGSDQGLQGALEYKRNWLVQQLQRYQKLKQFNLIVVFDGWRTGPVKESSEKSAGISIIYSRLGEKADQVIIRIAREKGNGAVVVSSDREIRNAVERCGAVAIHAGEFIQILKSVDGVGFEDDADDDYEIADKRGNPNRLGKAERKRIDKLKRLKL
jgi:uncharacterized protein